MAVAATRRERWAEHVTNRDMQRLKTAVLNGMRSHLHRRGVRDFDDSDLEDFYISAWYTYYKYLAEGKAVRNPEGFLVTVACRRAFDALRSPLHGLDRNVSPEPDENGVDYDIDEQLDQKALIRHFQEGLKERLTYREYQAATLCLIVGVSRPQAASLLGVSRDRIERLMDDAQRKIREFAPTVAGSEWCIDHESTIRAYALRVLAPHGPRYQAAKTHLQGCPGCRRLVLELRGLAAVAPLPVPASLAAIHAASALAGSGRMPGSGSPLHHVLRSHLTRALVKTARQARRLRSYLPAFKSGGAAGVGAGASAGAAGPTLIGSGVAAKVLAVCATLCVAGGAAVLGAHAIAPAPRRQIPARSPRRLGMRQPARPTVEARTTADPSATVPDAATSTEPVRTEASATTKSAAPTRPNTRSHGGDPQAADNETQQEFGFEGSDAETSEAAGRPTARVASRTAGETPTASESAHTTTTAASEDASHATDPSQSSAESEFGFEGQ